jgi:hypothetical protein
MHKLRATTADALCTFLLHDKLGQLVKENLPTGYVDIGDAAYTPTEHMVAMVLVLTIASPIVTTSTSMRVSAVFESSTRRYSA